MANEQVKAIYDIHPEKKIPAKKNYWIDIWYLRYLRVVEHCLEFDVLKYCQPLTIQWICPLGFTIYKSFF